MLFEFHQPLTWHIDGLLCYVLQDPAEREARKRAELAQEIAEKAQAAEEAARLAAERAKVAEAEAADEASRRKAQKAREEAIQAQANAKAQAEQAAQAAEKIQASIRGKAVRDEVGFLAELDGIAAERIQATIRGKETRDTMQDVRRGGQGVTKVRNTPLPSEVAVPRGGDDLQNAAAARLQGVARGHEAKQHIKAMEYAQQNAYVHPSKWQDDDEEDAVVDDGPSLAELERMMEERSRLRVAQIGFLQKREGEVGAAVMIQKLMRGHLARLKKKKAARPPQAAADAVPPRKNKFLAAAEEDFEEDYGQ